METVAKTPRDLEVTFIYNLWPFNLFFPDQLRMIMDVWYVIPNLLMLPVELFWNFWLLIPADMFKPIQYGVYFITFIPMLPWNIFWWFVEIWCLLPITGIPSWICVNTLIFFNLCSALVLFILFIILVDDPDILGLNGVQWLWGDDNEDDD